MQRWIKPALLTLVAGALLSGCHFVTLPDPNAELPQRPPEVAVMQRNVADAHRMLDRRVQRGQLTPEEKERRIIELCRQFAEVIDPKRVKPGEEWMAADILRQAGDLKGAQAMLEQGLKAPVNLDRKTNDTLQLARVLVMQGKVKEGIALARTTFDVPPREKGPILMAVLYEIVPAGRGKGQDRELAKLTEDAIDQHLQVLVDPNLDNGKAFLAAMPRHMEAAWETVIRLYRDADDEAGMRRAILARQRQDRTVTTY
jgi:hypothetical protein